MAASGQLGHQVNYDPNEAHRHVSILQLLQATHVHDEDTEEDRFVIDGIGFKTITVVASVHFVNGSRYTLHDGTGGIGVNYLPPQGVESPQFPEPAYARVTGVVSLFHNTRSIKASFIEPVQDPYEINYHILHTIVDTLTYERGPPPVDQNPREVFSHSQSYSQVDCNNSNLQLSQFQSKHNTPQVSPSKGKAAFSSGSNVYPRRESEVRTASPAPTVRDHSEPCNAQVSPSKGKAVSSSGSNMYPTRRPGVGIVSSASIIGDNSESYHPQVPPSKRKVASSSGSSIYTTENPEVGTTSPPPTIGNHSEPYSHQVSPSRGVSAFSSGSRYTTREPAVGTASHSSTIGDRSESYSPQATRSKGKATPSSGSNRYPTRNPGAETVSSASTIGDRAESYNTQVPASRGEATCSSGNNRHTTRDNGVESASSASITGDHSRLNSSSTSSGDTVRPSSFTPSNNVGTYPTYSKTSEGDTLLEPSSPSGRVSIPPAEPRIRQIPNSDPLSGLSRLERRIMLCIKYAKNREYDEAREDTGVDRDAWQYSWKGVDVELIVWSLQNRQPDITPEMFEAALKKLIDDAHIYNPVDDTHFDTLS